ncbi:MAG: hypothetical protein A3G34_13920 [Candidatus Lindowbacteria bacterium RIFCSPLOWO2_12_FULL_62_27]|nr:MAG: hypothetical protein A3I06_04065 [Candidatus Lindowbacteria bacterium RIFCSPLOWO2_02_FULL_62_12]OGH62668.1 MAG: hypothetical protein A3G34_13920 [Candidatus Lindowbacteria bacterium RIFCSPLOWO2_12_FULL_62_27]
MDGFFHIGFMDMGGLNACVFDHDDKRSVEFSVRYAKNGVEASYGLSLSKASADISLQIASINLKGKVAIPYGLNQNFPFSHTDSGEEYTINWNGVGGSVVPKNATAEKQQKAAEIAALINSVPERLKAIDIVPHKRGFFKYNYTPVAISPLPTSEDEVASIIINDQHMAGRISTYLEDIFGRDFRTYTPAGTATVFMQTTDKQSRIPVNLINDGFGINQVVYLWAKLYRPEISTVLIEEPEVHLHPTVIRNFARALCAFVKDEGKQVLLTTHSEQFVSSIATAVSEGIASPSDIGCYLTLKEKKTTKFQPQKINEKGQIDGGLTSFIEAEIEDLKKFTGV